MQDFSIIKKQHAVWVHEQREELVLIQYGCLVGNQWLKTGFFKRPLAKAGVVGQDRETHCVECREIRALKSMEEFNALRAASTPVFQDLLRLKDMVEDVLADKAIRYIHGPKCPYILLRIIFSKNSGVWESVPVPYKGGKGKPMCRVQDHEEQYSTFEEMVEAIKKVCQMLGRSSDVNEFIEECRTKGRCYITSYV